MIAIEDVRIAGYTLAVIVMFTIAAVTAPVAAAALTMPVCLALVLPCAVHLHRSPRRRNRERRP